MQPLLFYDVTSGAAIAPSLLTSIFNRQLSKGAIQLSCRIRVVNTQLQRMYVVDPPVGWSNSVNGVWDTSDLSRYALNDAQVQHDSSKPVHRSFNFTMADPDNESDLVTYLPLVTQAQANAYNGHALLQKGFPFNPFTCFFEVAQLWSIPSLGISFEAPLGFFNAIMPQATLKPGGRYFIWQCADLTTLIAQTPFISDYVVEKLYPGGYLQAWVDMMHVSGTPINQGGTGITPVGNPDAGPDIPLAMMPVGSTLFPSDGNQSVIRDVLFQAGTNRADAGNQCLDALNYYPAYQLVRQSGPNSTALSFCSRPVPIFSNGIPTYSWDFSTMPGAAIMVSPIQQNFSGQAQPGICNLVRVEATPSTQGAGAQSITYQAQVMNTNPNSVISTVNLKTLSGGPRAITLYERNDKCANQVMTNLRATLLLEAGAMLPEQLQLSMVHFPLFEDNDLVRIQVQNAEGEIVVPSDANSPFRIDSWTLPLAVAGRMNVSATRIVPI